MPGDPVATIADGSHTKVASPFMLRRALIVAPAYAGGFLAPLVGSRQLVKRLAECLKNLGRYEVELLASEVKKTDLNRKLGELFDSDGELLLYFYGHGCLNGGLGFFATTDGEPYSEGVEMSGVLRRIAESRAREVVAIFDCCHAGAAMQAAPLSAAAAQPVIQSLAGKWGRAVLMGCAAHQEGWETRATDQQKALGAFSFHVLEGLEGKARGHANRVRAGTLASYVTDVFSSWRQTPLSIVVDGGDYLCTITDLPAAAEPPHSDVSARQPSQFIGVPFRPSTFFVGRSSELDWLLTTLLDQRRRIAITASVEGLGGIGKTELILQLLHHPQMTTAFDVFLGLDAAGPLLPQWERTASELGIEVIGTESAEVVARIGAELRRRYRALIVLDNAHEWTSIAHLIPPVIPLVVTTRTRQFGGAAFIHQELTVLPPPAATELLVKSVSWLKDDPDLPRLVERLDGHALALEIAASNIQYWDLSARDYMERLNQYQTDTHGAPTATGARQTVDSCLALTWNALRHEASRTLWRRDSLFAPVPDHRTLLQVSFSGMPSTRYELHDLLGARYKDFRTDRLPPYLLHDAGEFPAVYAELRAVHVLGRVEGFNGERWAMHRLVRDFGRARLQKGEVMMHGLAMSEWLQARTLPLGPEIPHFVSTILDTARFVGEFRTAREGWVLCRRSSTLWFHPSRILTPARASALLGRSSGMATRAPLKSSAKR